jgi:hypothetical protein
MEDHTEPDAATQNAERSEAERSHTADRPPSTDEETEADDAYSAEGEDERREVAEHYQEMGELGAEVKGEGEIK